VVEIQTTPNPNALKFVLEGLVTDPPKSYFSVDSAIDNPLAVKVFAVPGVTSLLFVGDFLTINKSSEARWADIRDRVKQVLAAND
jgi:hypothetical protein